jgi:selenocysteine lyase/cysteine desulfurase
MDWASFRAAVPATEQVVYMNTGWSGPLCTPARDAIREQLDQEYLYGPTTPHIHEGTREAARRARAAIARLIGTTPDTVALAQSTAHAVNIVLGGLSFQPGDELVTTDAEHHALSVPAYYAERRHGLGLRIVPISGAMTEEELIACFDEAITARTRLVALSHAFFNVGVRLPARAIIDIAHARGALVLLDGAQAAGQFPVDVRALDADFYTVSGHKWLLAPTGAGGLYIRPELLDSTEPMMVARQATRTFDAHGHMEPRIDAVEKFDLTETSAPLWAGLTAAIEFIERTGPDAIYERVRALASRLRAALLPIDGVEVLSPPPGPLATGLVPFSVAGRKPDEVTSALWKRGKIVGRSVFGRQASRLTVHAFNTEAEVDHAAGLIRELAAEQS